MGTYILRRLLLIIPTLFGVMLLNFVIIQAAPGGPVEQIMGKIKGFETSDLGRITNTGAETLQSTSDSGGSYRGSQGLRPELLAKIKKMYGFDQPAYVRFFKMVRNYLTFNFGDSLFRDKSVLGLIKEKMPVSISLGLWSTLIIYLVSIPLGIRKAVRDGSRFDAWTSTAIITGYSIPGFLLAVLLIILFAGGTYFDWFPLKGLTSDNFHSLPWYRQIADYFWHLVLPVTANVVGGFATLTFLTKNSFMDEISKQYVVTARAKGLDENRILYGHVFRNAMLIVISGIPNLLVSLFFTSSLLIEVMFSLDGLGLLSYQATLDRDYPVVFGTLYLFTLIGLVLKLLSDITYFLVDPRIDFESRES